MPEARNDQTRSKAEWMDQLHTCWQEFEAGESADAAFARAVDRLQPVLLNMLTQGGTWQSFHVTLQQVRERTSAIAGGSTQLAHWAEIMFSVAAQEGWLKKGPPTDLP